MTTSQYYALQCYVRTPSTTPYIPTWQETYNLSSWISFKMNIGIFRIYTMALHLSDIILFLSWVISHDSCKVVLYYCIVTEENTRHSTSHCFLAPNASQCVPLPYCTLNWLSCHYIKTRFSILFYWDSLNTHHNTK